MLKTLTTAFLFLLFQVTSLFAQPYIMNHFTVKDGLPSNAIRSMNEDAQGNLWIVTDNGVVKYNGSTFKTYNFDNVKMGSVFDIFPASDGRIYLIDYVKNLDYIYNEKLYTINTGEVHFRVPYEQFGNVYGVDGIGNTNQIKGDSFINVTSSIPKFALRKLLRTKDEPYPYVMVAYPYAVRVEDHTFTAVHMKTGKLVTATHPPFSATLSDGNGGVYKSKVYFVIANKIIICYDPEKNVFYDKRLDDKTGIAYVVRQSMFSRNGLLQVTTNNGLLLLDEWLQPVDSLRINVQQEGVLAIYQDVARNCWLLTNSGLKSIGSYFRNVKVYPSSDNKNIAYFNDQLYVVHQNGNVSVYDTAMKLKKEIVIEDAMKYTHSPVFYSTLERPDSLIIATDKNITVIKKDGSHSSLKLSELETVMIKPLKAGIYYKDDLMIITYEGLCKINVSGRLFEYNRIGRFNKVLVGTNDSLFACNNNGIYYVSQKKVIPYSRKVLATINSEVAIPYSNSLIDTIKKVTGFSIPDFFVSDENHWIAASNNHIFTWNKITRQIKRHDVISKVSFLKAEKNNLWIGTQSMLFRYIKDSSGEYTLHNKYYNFGYNLYQNIADITSTATSIFLSTDHGIVKVPIDADENNNIILRVPTISRIVYGKGQYYQRGNDTAYQFDYSPSSLSVDLSVNTISYDKDVTYQYYVEGIDRQWQATSSSTITYSTLKPGSYKFHYKISLDKYDLHGKEQIVVITIMPLWWQSSLLRIILVLILAVILGFIVVKLSLRRKDQMLRKALMEKNISSVKLSALQSQMNPHFIFNAMASIQSFVKQKRNDIAEESLTEFATLIRLYLEFSRKPLITLEEELSTLRLYTSIEMKRFENKFGVEFDVDTERPYTEILLPPLFIQPFVENAISHGLYHKLNGKGSLLISIVERQGEIVVTVDDNGVGRDKANSINEGMRKNTSRGLQLIGERIKILNETGMVVIKINTIDKTDAGGQPEGTRVIIHFKTNIENDQGTSSRR
jgi:ligand-binding sensor domain-containing protein